jgi:FlaA1/EpsC-like NDP-sugar epimerase
MREHPWILSKYRSWFVAVFQAVLISISLVLAWLLRFDFSLPERKVLLISLPVLVLIRLAAIAQFRLLHGWWRYTGVSDALDVLKAVTSGSVVFWVVSRYVLQLATFPRSVYILEALLTTGLLTGVRLLSRAIAESAWHDKTVSKGVVIIGAGFAAQLILREISRPDSRYVAIGCVDDDRSKRGMKIHGVPVLGTVDQLPDLLARYPADEVLIAVPSATSAQMQRFVQVCEQAGVPFKTVPALRDVIAGEVSISQLREVNLDDLLGREPARIDLESVRRLLQGRTVLVTGAAGSIGSELCRQILKYEPATLVFVDQSETGIFYSQLEFRRLESRTNLHFCVCDIGDRDRISGLLFQHKPQVIFHAAAYKHVPVMETNVHEAVNNNVFKFLTLLELAHDVGCENFVLISSDKAVNPTSIMGATKRICELVLSSWPANKMSCVSVRFGNVLGSSGSVVPVFRSQLRNNQELTITHPEIKRFFMTLHEAVALVLQGFALGNHGDILVLDMGEPVLILDLAKNLIRLSGKTADQVKIRFTGLREGEKLIEELTYSNELVHSTSCDRIKRIRATLTSWPEFKVSLEELKLTLSVDGAAPIRAKVKEIIPEYSSPELPASQSNQSTDPPLKMAARQS